MLIYEIDYGNIKNQVECDRALVARWAFFFIVPISAAGVHD